MGKYLSGRVPKNLTLCRIHEIFKKKYHVKALEQGFPMMYLNTIVESERFGREKQFSAKNCLKKTQLF